MVDPLPKPEDYPQLQEPPEANCKRYEALYSVKEVTS
jgi:hypothetical protein